MLSKEEFQHYFNNNIGINLLNVWVSENKIEIKKYNEVAIPATLSHLFKIDLPEINESNFSILMERKESNWFQKISWERVVVDLVNKKFIFVSKRVDGDKNILSDIPPIAVSIPYDLTSKIRLLGKEKRINMKEYAIVDGDLLIGKPLVKNIPLYFLQKQTKSYLTPIELEKYTTNKNLIDRNIKKSNVFEAKYVQSRYGDHISSEFSYLTKPFNPDEVASYAKGIGETYTKTGDLEEFAKKEYNYGAWYENNLARNESERISGVEKNKWW